LEKVVHVVPKVVIKKVLSEKVQLQQFGLKHFQILSVILDFR